MSDFERRLHAMHRRPTDAAPNAATTKVAVDTSSLGWLAAERITTLSDVKPGTSIKVIVEGLDDHCRLEVHWGEDGVPSVQQF